MKVPYPVMNDPTFKHFISKKRRITDSTKEVYGKLAHKFVLANDMSLTEIVQNIEEEQTKTSYKEEQIPQPDGSIKVIQRDIKKYNPNDYTTKIYQYFVRYREFCEERGNSVNTINNEINHLLSIFRKLDIDVPSFEMEAPKKVEWTVLQKEDIRYVLDNCTLAQQSLAIFLLSTGMRLSDALALDIGTYMKATSDFHDFVEVDDFIDNAPEKMMGYFRFEPIKTQRNHTECATFNSYESNAFILANLRRIKNSYIPAKKKKGIEIKLTKKDSLFGSPRHQFKKAAKRKGISSTFLLKNKGLEKMKIAEIDQKIANGELSQEDREEAISKLPKFHIHALRKYFITNIDEHCGSIRVAALLEGHTPPMKNDSSYNDISKDRVLKEYMNAIESLTIYDRNLDKLNEEKNKTLEKEVSHLQKQVEELTNQIQHEREMYAGQFSENPRQAMLEQGQLARLKILQKHGLPINKTQTKDDSDLEEMVRKILKEMLEGKQ